MPRIGRKQPGEIAVVGLGRREGVERLLLLVVLFERLAEPTQRIDTLPSRARPRRSPDLAHQLVDIFDLLQRRPTSISRPPVRTGPQPHRKGLGEILVRMALRIPQPQMLDVTPAGRIGPVVAWVVFRRRAEQLLPASPALQLVAVLYGVACFVTEDGHALAPCSALDVEHHLLLELHQAGMSEIERNGDAGNAARTEPFARHPGVRPQPDAALLELLVQRADAILEPGAFDRYPQAGEALLEQLIIRQLLPGKFPAWHRASRGQR